MIMKQKKRNYESVSQVTETLELQSDCSKLKNIQIQLQT